jgi:SAM-dependent methyltransferase
MTPTTRIGEHYGREGLGRAIVEALRAAGAPIEALSVDDLAPIDHFHTRGQAATLDLLRLASVDADARVLDVGGGLGGAARFLASTVGCHVTVVDLTEAYVTVGRDLTRRVRLDERIDFVHADALAAPFPDGEFDVVWMQHCSMNIADKEGLYREAHRVLRPGGRLAMHEAMAGPVQPIHLPVTWARHPADSHLSTPDDVRGLLAALGFRELAWEDQSAISLEFNRRRAEAAAQTRTPPPLGLHVLLGADYGAIVGNQARNIDEDRVRIIMAAWEKGPLTGRQESGKGP